jgi:hypothetical protein
MWIRLATHYPFAVIKEPLAYYRQLSGSMSKNCQVMEESFRIVIERTFESAPSDLLYLKNRSYGHANLCLAWKALQSSDRNYKLALHFQGQAISHFPQLRYSRESIRLSFAIAAMRLLGPHGYSRVLALAYALRRRTLSVG